MPELPNDSPPGPTGEYGRDAAPSPDDPACRAAAAAILQRYDAGDPEANITSAVRDFLIATGLASADRIVEEYPPSPDAPRHAVDLTALDTFIEVKRRIGLDRGLSPNADYVRQLDDYLAASERGGRVRMGILTDGKRWVLRWPGAGEAATTRPHAFTLESAERWIPLYEWLRDEAIEAREHIRPDRADIERRFGVNSPRYRQDIDTLRALFEEARANPATAKSVDVKRRLWQDLLRTALGEIAQGETAMDDLFIRHTYLTIVIGIVVQASFGIDVRSLAVTDARDLVLGARFKSDTGIQGVVESDFFAWPTEIGADAFLATLARRIARFDWLNAPPDIAAILYETVIPPAERRQLGEYYTPAWLARAMVGEMIDEPLTQRVLDPACGSGTFLAEAITHFIGASERDRDPRNYVSAKSLLETLRENVIGIDIHPVAVHLARAAWVLAAKPLFDRVAQEGIAANYTAPVYLGDSLQLRYRTDDMFARDDVTIPVRDEQNTELIFPRSLVDDAENFDAVMAHITSAIEDDGDPLFALRGVPLTDTERAVMVETIRKLQTLRKEGRDHIWAYYTRNMVRPIALSLPKGKVDVIIGNPPWLTYNKTIAELRRGLERLSKERYGIWQGGRHTPNQDVAGLFYTRSVDLYLKDGGVIGMVLPHSALQSGQYAKWRTGLYRPTEGTSTQGAAALSVDFSVKPAWDLERLQPNTFFPVPSSVVFARLVAHGAMAPGKPLAGSAERWIGPAGSDDITRETVTITDTSQAGESPYAKRARKGADIYPRALMFVEETEGRTVIRRPGTIVVNPRRGSQDKAPWRDLDLTDITRQTIETAHVYDVHLGETLVPYGTLEPRKAVLPLRRGDKMIATDTSAVGGVRPDGMEELMRDRWRTISHLWETNKGPNVRTSLMGNLDHWGKLTAQLEWQLDNGGMPIRVVHSSSGFPTAALLEGRDAYLESTAYWIPCKDIIEARFLLSIINSDVLYEAMEPLMPKGQFGARHVQKHLWRLPIPLFDEHNQLHIDISAAGGAYLVLYRANWRSYARSAERNSRSRSRGVRSANGCGIPKRGRKWRTSSPASYGGKANPPPLAPTDTPALTPLIPATPSHSPPSPPTPAPSPLIPATPSHSPPSPPTPAPSPLIPATPSHSPPSPPTPAPSPLIPATPSHSPPSPPTPAPSPLIPAKAGIHRGGGQGGEHIPRTNRP